jgi:hypothetical protein
MCSLLLENYMKKILCAALMIILIAISSIANAQKKIIAFDFESSINVKDWYVDNKEIILSQCDKDCDQVPGSGKCLRIEWDRVPEKKSYIWLTDIKIDTFGNNAMGNTWNGFKENTWLSFKVNTSDGDSVYFQFVVFTKDEKDKWGSRKMTGFKSASWKTIKVKLSDLQFDNWGKGNIATPDFSSIIPARIEIGVRSAQANEKGKIDARLDDIVFTNYEP